MSPSFTPLSLLTPLLLMLLGGGLLTVWWRWRNHNELGWMGSSLACSGVGILLQLFHWPQPLLAYVLGFSVCYLYGTGAVAQSLAVRLGVSLPRKALAVLVTCILGLQIWFSAVDPNLALRVPLFTIGVMLVMALPLFHWRRMVLHSRFDWWLRTFYVACIVLNLLRTAVLLPLTEDVDTAAFPHSPFWMAVHFSALLSAVALAGSMLVAVGWGVIHALQQERNLDALTGVLHGKGLAQQLRRLERQGPQRRMLLLCEVDRWSWIQVRWGGAAAACVLQVAARLLQRNVRAGDMVARLEGATFAVLLQGGDLTLALPVAERMRREMAQLRVPMLVGERVTLSIGVADVQVLNAASMEAAMDAARQLLTSAQKAGCNRVRGGQVPTPPPQSMAAEV